MKKKLLSLLFIFIVFSVVACGTSTEQGNNQDEALNAETTEEVKYANDAVVNEFIKSYNEISDSQFTEIKQGNIKTKYYAESYGYYCELLHANDTDKICVTINETNETAEIGTAGMGDIFFYTAKVIDPNLIDEDIHSFFDMLTEDPKGIDYELGNMKISFFKDAELSNGHSRGHIEISSK